MNSFFVAYHEVILEAVAITVGLMIAFVMPRRHRTRLRVLERRLGDMTRQHVILIPLLGLLVLGGSATFSLLGRTPEPAVHDEFSYLLAADTFASGRLSNPTHPLWVHFESFHIIQQPTYASKYPPAQGLMLALGQLIGGHPILGVWISTSLACAAIYWMLLAWVPSRWAMLGGLLVALHPGIFLVWGQSYWGGTVSATGGALLFGSWKRLVCRPCVRYALLLGIGLVVLANSRPYEGAVVSVPVAVALLVWLLGKNKPTVRVSIGRVMLPILVTLAATAGVMGFYNWRVTGNAWLTPYQVYESTYSPVPLFLWQPLQPMPAYRHMAMRDFYLYVDYLFKKQRSVRGIAWMGWHKVKTYWTFYQGGRYARLLFTIPLVMVPWLLKDRWSRIALLICSLLAVGLLLEPWMQPHYAAPVTGLVVMLVLQGLRRNRLWRWRGEPVGQVLVCAIVLAAIASFVITIVQHAQSRVLSWQFERARLLKELQGDGRRHLVVVRYGSRHQVNNEWVYNEADIDGAKVVWAREMDSIQMRRLLEYFRDRQPWLAEIDGDDAPQKLVPYAIEMTP